VKLPPLGRSQWLRGGIGLALAAVLIVVVERWLGWGKLLAPWRSLGPAELAGALLLVLGTHGLRALRFRRFFAAAREAGIVHALQLVLRHNFFNNLLPMRSGEISFPLLARQTYGIGVGHAVGGLLLFRLLDLHTIAWLGSAALYWTTRSPGWLAAALVLLPLPLAGHALARRWRSLPERLSGRLRDWLAPVFAAVPESRGPFVEAWAWTVATWVGKLAVFAWLLTRFGHLGFGLGWLGATAGDLTSVLPIHGWAGAGTYEAGVVAVLSPFGIDAAAALAMAVNLHLFILGTTVIGGLIAMAIPSRQL